MVIDPDYLNPGTHVIAAVASHGVGQSPHHSKNTSTLLLSSVGELLYYHPNELLSATFRCGHVSDLISFELNERTVHHPVKLAFWKMSSVLYILVVSFLILLMGVILYDQAVNGFVSVSQSPDGSVSTQDLATGVMDGLMTFLLAVTIFAPILYCFVFEGSVPTYVTPRTASLTFKDNTNLFISEAPEWSKIYRLMQRLAMLVLVFVLLISVPTADLVILITTFAVYLLSLLFLAWGIVKLAENRESEVGELRTGNLLRFYRVLNDVARENTTNTPTPLGREDSTAVKLETVKDKVGEKIVLPLERLYQHQATLNQLTDGEWEAMLTTEKFYFSLAQIRRCTEKMLYVMISRYNIKIKPQNRGIQTMQQRLQHHDVLTVEAIKYIEVIKAIANPAAHDMSADADDFIAAFTAFVSFTTWFVDAQSNEEE